MIWRLEVDVILWELEVEGQNNVHIAICAAAQLSCKQEVQQEMSQMLHISHALSSAITSGITTNVSETIT